MKAVRFWFGLFAVFYLSCAHAQLNGYDEVFDQNGEVRPHYQAVYEAWKNIPAKKRSQIFAQSKVAFSGDNYLEVLPRVLTKEEFEHTIKPGITQRAQAIRAFLLDHYSGNKNYLKDKIVPGEVVKRALQKTTELGYDGKLDPARIAFIYGPDIIRDSDGVWRVIEDNPGYVGGIGDLELAYKYLAKVFPEIKNLKPKSPEEFYKGLTDVFKKRAAIHKGRVVMFFDPPYYDNEDPRMKDLLESNGVTVVTPDSQMQLKVKSSGVYVYDSEKGFEKSKERVGFIYINGEHDSIDPSYFEVQKKLIYETAMDQLEEMSQEREDYKNEIREYEKVLYSSSKKTGEIDYKKLLDLIAQSEAGSDFDQDLKDKIRLRGIVKAIIDGKVESSYSPGVDFIGDKELYIYVPEMIKYYLGEQPILQNIPTQSFADPVSGELRKKEFEEVFKDMKNHVIKPTDGRGGSGVYIGPYVTKREVKLAQKEVKSNPGNFIHQSLTTLSHIRNLIVDLRGYAFVDGKGVWVGNHMFSRGLPMDRDKNGKLRGNGKVNLSDEGRELLVIIDRAKENRKLTLNRCVGLF